MQPPVAGILLAAGEGSRLGRPKALVEIGGQRLADRGVALLRAGGTAAVIAVTGSPDDIDTPDDLDRVTKALTSRDEALRDEAGRVP